MISPAEDGVERIEARFQGNGFSPHRHDTYAIGLTMNGVQTFSYRGEQRASLPGQVIVIHPDEVHDGGAGTEEGLRYRMLYVAPEQISDVLSGVGRPGLPFVPSPVISDNRFRTELAEALTDIDRELGTLKRDCLIADLADCLWGHSDHQGPSGTALSWPDLKRCAEFLKENCTDSVRMEQLEGLAQMDRFTLSRQFRAVFGTSPHRYLVMRRLGRAKAELGAGAPLVEAAVASGFADQSHMTRHFKRAFGMTPGQWRHLSAASATQ
ncbi:AraC family transcriptional regulator [Roseibium sp. Sym1]|uniref:AraC family transcriptional regulator n=1 Tax=Roseibium sp. Sym1 TaxID=3016006 RepID=UPI0022B3BCF4|nr:AraC family transcriptional regulator [Roseibium sp. Sym1]